ncbi:tyrosine-protein phosphatase [Nonomuraea sp. PA05]|uniref:tyrosine-protein phosphatase n=1 Tax=Nonomuraea sp. PA05 TaxID=2604466 RepID=UPI0011D5BB42|nr:tyrosine-protein phosphatase [Nonomuraea sp. PA05]TYB60620.1 tyrosine-protein phosphatase [Nonomuraea sp. PA05]
MLINLRDVGHLAGAPLYRSAQPHGLAVADAAALAADLGLRTIIDLRSLPEQEAVPWPLLPDGVRVHSIPFGPGTTSVDNLSWIIGPADMGVMYAHMARESAADLVRIVRLLSEGPALVHCAAGKDRTGVVIAITLSLLGVEAARISEDYALTEAAMPALMKSWEAAAAQVPMLTAIPEILMRAPAEAMLAFLTELGDVRALLDPHGLTDADLTALRAAFERRT